MAVGTKTGETGARGPPLLLGVEFAVKRQKFVYMNIVRYTVGLAPPGLRVKN